MSNKDQLIQDMREALLECRGNVLFGTDLRKRIDGLMRRSEDIRQPSLSEDRVRAIVREEIEDLAHNLSVRLRG